MTYVNTTRLARKGLFDRFVAFRDAAAVALRQRQVYAQTVAELDALSQRELSDLGIDRSSIRSIAREAAYGK